MNQLELAANELGISQFNRNRSRNVLLVEDDLYWQKVIGSTLRAVDRNIQVHCVKSAAHAKVHLVATNFDLIVSDYFLEGSENGAEFMASCLDRKIPFLFVSGMREQEFFGAVKNQNIGSTKFWSKSVNLAGLKAAFEWQFTKGVPGLAATSVLRTSKSFHLAELAFVAAAVSLAATKVQHPAPLVMESAPMIKQAAPLKVMAKPRKAITLDDLLSDADRTMGLVNNLKNEQFILRKIAR